MFQFLIVSLLFRREPEEEKDSELLSVIAPQEPLLPKVCVKIFDSHLSLSSAMTTDF